MVKTNLEAQAVKMTRLAREKFPPGRVGDTVKVRVPDVDRGRCDSRNILGVITEVEGRSLGTKLVIRRINSTDKSFLEEKYRCGLIVKSEGVPSSIP